MKAKQRKGKMIAYQEKMKLRTGATAPTKNTDSGGSEAGAAEAQREKKVNDCTTAHHHHSQGSLTPTLGCSLRKSWSDLKFGESKAGQEGSSRKKSQTLTSVLTARSKAACDLTDKPKPKEQIVDINAVDIDNKLAVVEYVEDIYKFYKQVENESRVHDYMDSQPKINEKIRAILVDWLIEVHNKFELMPETLYLTINIVDRYLASKSVMRRELQAYTNEQVLITEKRILRELEWSLTVPTPYVFLARFIKAAVADQHMENMVYFLAELGIMNYATIIYCPSMLAASAVYTARCTLNKSPAWNDTLKLHTGFSETQLMDFAKLLVSFHLIAAENKLKVIYRKWKMNGSSN
ncbi:hypothetical protein HYC85_024048 [Camellia sinensis]|uniref:Cyclin N-terminal domain-containing protein n=1 Tax=Camellia sinensis TaxID=4442 RepID=A0A7J7G6Z5_CAMSI|nr:hypothetical protein HYC85_024048 [Camellia sinensis]